MHDLRDRNLASKGKSPKQAEITVKWSNILQCLCNATTPEKKKKKKKEKGKLAKRRTADTTTTKKKFLGFTVHVQERCPDPRSRSMICDRSRHAKLGRKISLCGFCLFFKPRLPQKDGVHLVSIPRDHWHRLGQKKMIVDRMRTGARAADTVDPLISVTPARPRVCECPPPLALPAGRHFDE